MTRKKKPPTDQEAAMDNAFTEAIASLRAKYLPESKAGIQPDELPLWWKDFLGRIQRVFSRLPQVKQQAQFKDYSLQDPDDVATYRTIREIQITHAKFWKKKRPTTEFMGHCRERWHAYLDATLHARKLLDQIVFPKKLHTADLRTRTDQEKGFPPLEYVPRHLEYAQLHSLGLLAGDVFRDYMAGDFLKLTKAQWSEFHDVLRARKTKAAKYGVLVPWVAYNMPVFREFNWQWPDIQWEVEQRHKKGKFPTRTGDHEDLNKLADASGVKRGRGKSNHPVGS